MKIDVMGLLRQSAEALKHRDRVLAFSTYELANNLGMLMRGEATLEEFKAVYVGADREPFDLDVLMPAPAEDWVDPDDVEEL